MVSNVKSQDAFHIKQCLPQYIIPLDPNVNKNEYFILDAGEDLKETQWGWHSNILSQFLPHETCGWVWPGWRVCPLWIIIICDDLWLQGPSKHMFWLATSILIYLTGQSSVMTNQSMTWRTLSSQGYFFLHIYRHIFSGPSSTLKKKDKGWNSCGQKNCLLVPTPETIGYAEIIVCICGIYNQTLT